MRKWYCGRFVLTVPERQIVMIDGTSPNISHTRLRITDRDGNRSSERPKERYNERYPEQKHYEYCTRKMKERKFYFFFFPPFQRMNRLWLCIVCISLPTYLSIFST